MRTFPPEYRLSDSDHLALQRFARSKGYDLVKSRWHLGSVDNHGGYRIVDLETNTCLAGVHFELTGAEVAAWVENDAERWIDRY